jgi:hypothetical protein
MNSLTNVQRTIDACKAALDDALAASPTPGYPMTVRSVRLSFHTDNHNSLSKRLPEDSEAIAAAGKGPARRYVVCRLSLSVDVIGEAILL